ncbi:hypothetical protein SCHPADRAFT_912975 [Schizopora paradoxa]|uniref:Prokaryotic-type class I peptide chain release factors domain-containing protein n=1 Tax=Schizopora paradoxa TaxID=27342 RepID=A0A0H2S3X0_9AGAM|nr:hypothetical protein SCHPADRAFT_912975 [Schizopora paradoxa]
MSITQELRASARSAYRSLLRASSSTFRGDERVLRAFREKIRTDARSAETIADPVVFAGKNQLGREIADIIRRNVVQGVRVDGSASPGASQSVQEDRWRLRYTEHTELGSNEDRFGPTSKSSSGGCCQDNSKPTSQPSVIEEDLPPEHSEELKPKEQTTAFYSVLKRQHKQRIIPQLLESDLEESFVRGSGPGGQSINKTRNNVQLLHKPTGIRVTCQETRSLTQNREFARKWLLEKLDHYFNPGLSKEDMKRAKQRERERRRKKKASRKLREKEEERGIHVDEDA